MCRQSRSVTFAIGGRSPDLYFFYSRSYHRESFSERISASGKMALSLVSFVKPFVRRINYKYLFVDNIKYLPIRVSRKVTEASKFRTFLRNVNRKKFKGAESYRKYPEQVKQISRLIATIKIRICINIRRVVIKMLVSS